MKIYDSYGISVKYDPHFYETGSADDIFNQLLLLPFANLTFKTRGQEYTPLRKVYGFGDSGLCYNISGNEISAQTWSSVMLSIKKDVEKILKTDFNFALLNFYSDGRSYIGAHCDTENAESCICCLSFGATRDVVFKKIGNPCATFTIPSSHGSMYVMMPPTNELFTHAIPPQNDVMSPRISITFHRLNFGEPLRKKFRSYENVWDLERFYLENDKFLSIREHSNIGVRVHLHNQDFGIIMTPATWSAFTEKMYGFNTVYNTASFIANNQLAVFSDDRQCVLQQIFKESKCFSLKTNFIILSDEDLIKLSSMIGEIEESLKKCILIQYLPRHIIGLTCNKPTHVDKEKARENLFKVLYSELCVQMNKLYRCNGCILDHPSQRRHECLMDSDRLKYSSVGDKAFYYINFENVVNDLHQNYCICKYTMDFLCSINVSEYENNFKLLSQE